jgi:hypothetical protein
VILVVWVTAHCRIGFLLVGIVWSRCAVALHDCRTKQAAAHHGHLWRTATTASFRLPMGWLIRRTPLGPPHLILLASLLIANEAGSHISRYLVYKKLYIKNNLNETISVTCLSHISTTQSLLKPSSSLFGVACHS